MEDAAKLYSDVSFRFLMANGDCGAAKEWLGYWAGQYPRDRYPSIEHLIARHESLSEKDFETIGRWKDAALNERWKPNVASVAYPVWLIAAKSLPNRDRSNFQPAAFLAEWAGAMYTDTFGNGRTATKRFGLSRASTLLHFITGGAYPIFDSRVRRAVRRLTRLRPEQTVEWYLNSYCSLFKDLMLACETTDNRIVDEALFSYGDRGLKLLD